MSLKFFIDTEFIEDGITIDLISIGIVCDDGRELYLLNVDCDWSKANQWVQDNVLVHLPAKPSDFEYNDSHRYQGWIRHSNIGDIVHHFMGGQVKMQQVVSETDVAAFKHILYIPETVPKPELWGYYSAYDHVVLCQIFGTMMDLPKGFPMYTMCLKQWCKQLGDPELPAQGKGEHSAILDAKWNRDVWHFLNEYSKQK